MDVSLGEKGFDGGFIFADGEIFTEEFEGRLIFIVILGFGTS